MIKNFAKLGLILAAFSAVACVGLAFVYAATEKQIAAQESIQLRESLKSLFPDATAFDEVELGSTVDGISFDAAYRIGDANAPLGLAVKARGTSYGGISVMLVGVGLDRRIVGVRVLDIKDTPGLGANAAVPTYFVDRTKKTTFPGQFAGKPLGDPFEVKKDVAAITASTITSKALTKIIKAAGDAAAAWLESAALAGAATGGK
jgi:electron transport complex protein RnfG